MSHALQSGYLLLTTCQNDLDPDDDQISRDGRDTAGHLNSGLAARSDLLDRHSQPRSMGGSVNRPPVGKDDSKKGDGSPPKQGDRRDRNPPKQGHRPSGDKGSKDDDRRKDPSQGKKPQWDGDGYSAEHYNPRRRD